MTRASACRDALKSFIEGYQEGIQQYFSSIPILDASLEIWWSWKLQI
ncbi:hypothetical protein Gotur_024834 [Gossypium turneri]